MHLEYGVKKSTANAVQAWDMMSPRECHRVPKPKALTQTHSSPKKMLSSTYAAPREAAAAITSPRIISKNDRTKKLKVGSTAATTTTQKSKYATGKISKRHSDPTSTNSPNTSRVLSPGPKRAKPVIATNKNGRSGEFYRPKNGTSESPSKQKLSNPETPKTAKHRLLRKKVNAILNDSSPRKPIQSLTESKVEKAREIYRVDSPQKKKKGGKVVFSSKKDSVQVPEPVPPPSPPVEEIVKKPKFNLNLFGGGKTTIDKPKLKLMDKFIIDGKSRIPVGDTNGLFLLLGIDEMDIDIKTIQQLSKKYNVILWTSTDEDIARDIQQEYCCQGVICNMFTWFPEIQSTHKKVYQKPPILLDIESRKLLNKTIMIEPSLNACMGYRQNTLLVDNSNYYHTSLVGQMITEVMQLLESSGQTVSSFIHSSTLISLESRDYQGSEPIHVAVIRPNPPEKDFDRRGSWWCKTDVPKEDLLELSHTSISPNPEEPLPIVEPLMLSGEEF